jgi:hypothetical protein
MQSPFFQYRLWTQRPQTCSEGCHTLTHPLEAVTPVASQGAGQGIASIKQRRATLENFHRRHAQTKPKPKQHEFLPRTQTQI